MDTTTWVTRISNAGNLMVSTNGGLSYSHATPEQFAALGVAPYSNSLPAYASYESRREIRATEAQIRAEYSAPSGSTEEEIAEIGMDAYEDSIEG